MDWLTNIGAAIGGLLIGILSVEVIYLKKELKYLKNTLKAIQGG